MPQPLARVTPEFIPIGGYCLMSVEDDMTICFHCLEVVERHQSGDSRDRNLPIARIADMKVTLYETNAVFGVSRPTVNRSLSLYRAEDGRVFYKLQAGDDELRHSHQAR